MPHMERRKDSMKCKYCGKEFTKTHNRQMYCSPKCSTEAEKENTRNRVHKWYHRNKHNLSEKRRWGLGTGELGPHRHEDWEIEREKIEKEMQRLRLPGK